MAVNYKNELDLNILHEVAAHPLLWDSRLDEYKDSENKPAIWLKIADKLQSTPGVAMSGRMPNVSDSDPCEPPPPYSMVVGQDVDAQGKTEAYRSPEYLSQGIRAQMGDYTAPPGYPPHAVYPPPSAFSPQHPGPYSAPPPPTGYNTAYIQQPGSYAAGPQQTTVIVQQPLLTPAVRPFREMPVRTVCPKCQASVVTVTYSENGTLTWLLCVILCLIGCDAGCCLIPFCADSCKDIVHVCPNCHQYISTYHRL